MMMLVMLLLALAHDSRIFVGASALMLLSETAAAAVDAVGDARFILGPSVQTVSLLQRGVSRPGLLPANWPAPAPPAVSALLPHPVAVASAGPQRLDPPAPAPPTAAAAPKEDHAEAHSDEHRPAAQTLAPAPSVNPAELVRSQPSQARARDAEASASGSSATSEADLSDAEGADLSDAEGADVGVDRVCVPPAEVEASLRESAAAVLKGMPPWPHKDAGPKVVEAPVLAYLIQVSFAEQLPLVARVFTRIYTPQDVFVYLVDGKLLEPRLVRAALPAPLPANVAVRRARHAGYYYWPRVQVLLDGLARLLEQRWDFVVHLSESDYPVHSTHWLRRTLGRQRQRSFLKMVPRCTAEEPEAAAESWYWWARESAVASCESSFEPTEVPTARFPMEELERHGFRFAKAPEWMVLTRELVHYATRPQLGHFKRLIGMHAAADEIFWATLVLNIPGFKQSLGHQAWFIHWNQAAAGHSPETVTAEHLPRILENRQRYFFARKVDEESSREVLEELDKLIKLPEDDAQGLDEQGVPWDRGALACRASEAPPPAEPGQFPPPAPPAEPAEASGVPDCQSPLCM